MRIRATARRNLRRTLPLLVLALGFLGLQNAWRLGLFIHPVNSSALTADDVTLYSTSWCGYCAKTRRFFAAAGIPYRERDIERSPAAAREYQALGGGGVPLIKIGDQVVRGFDTEAIRNALATASPHGSI